MSFTITREQREKAIKNIIKASQGKVRGENRLSALREEQTEPEPQKKAFLECLCEKRKHNGKTYLFSSPDCPVPNHGSFKENPHFDRPSGPIEGAGRNGRRKVYQGE